MKKWTVVIILFLLLALAINSAMAAGDVTINKSNFPDDNFREYVKKVFDQDGNGKLSQTELDNVTSVTVNRSYIEDLTGIAYFKNLKYLSCSENYITKLDVSKNTALTDLSCGSNKLKTLDLKNNTELTYLHCNNCQIKTLDVSKNTSLERLYCFDNKLTKLDISKNLNLIRLYCNNNQLNSLDVTKNTNLEILDCDNNLLSILNVSKNTKLRDLRCGNNELTSLDVSKNTKLRRLNCNQNHLCSLDLSKNTWLESLNCWGNEVQISTYDGKIAYKDLPGFKTTKVSDIHFYRNTYPYEGDLKKGKTAFTVPDSGTINYTYDLGQGFKKEFTIKVTYHVSKITSISLQKSMFNYTGESIKPNVTVKAKVGSTTKTLNKDTDYTVTYKNNTKAGTATVTVKGTGHYMGTITKKFTIKPVKILKVSLSNYKLPYTGKARKPIPTVTTKVNGQLVTLTKNTDYTVKYDNNIEIGTATVTITGKGNYTGTITKTFTIE